MTTQYPGQSRRRRVSLVTQVRSSSDLLPEKSVPDRGRFTAALIMPGLSEGQRERVRDLLFRIGRVPSKLLALVSADCDTQAAHVLNLRVAARAALRGECFPFHWGKGPDEGITNTRLDGSRSEPSNATAPAEAIAAEHQIPLSVASFAFGCACGLRLGFSFVKVPKRPKQSISEDWGKLHPQNRRQVARLIRSLLRIQEPDDPRRQHQSRLKLPIGDDLATAKRWAREAGQRARAEGRR